VLYGGFVDYELQLGKAISKQLDVMMVLPIDKLSEEFQQSIDSKINYYTFENVKTTNYLDKIRILIDLLKTIHRYKPDIVHLQLGGGILDFSIFLYSYVSRIPTVITYHDVNLHLGEQHPFTMIVTRGIMRKFSKAIIVHGKKLQEQMIKEHRVPADKVYSVHIGEHEVAPFKIYERPEITEDESSILFFGRIYEYKGLEYLIKAEQMITSKVPNCKIVIAGNGENFGKYDDMIQNRKEYFIVHNYRISYKEGADLFQRSCLVVLPYVEASQSGVIPTAYGFKKPVVVTNVGSIPELVDEGITGFIVPPRDSQALAEAIIKVLKDDKLRREMGENAFIKLKRDFSWKNICEQTIEIYNNILSQKRK
jgi:glycosyltransferase involved in cell wall biosynthesis